MVENGYSKPTCYYKVECREPLTGEWVTNKSFIGKTEVHVTHKPFMIFWLREETTVRFLESDTQVRQSAVQYAKELHEKVGGQWKSDTSLYDAPVWRNGNWLD